MANLLGAGVGIASSAAGTFLGTNTLFKSNNTKRMIKPDTIIRVAW
jgi:hypothetical protein